MKALGEDSVVVAVHHALGMLHNATYGLESSGAYLPVESRAHQMLLMNGPPPPVLARYNVGYLIGSSSQFHGVRIGQQIVAEAPSFELALARNPSPVRPRAYISSRVERIAPGADFTSLSRREAFAKGDLDYIEDARPAPGAPGGIAGGRARVVSYEPERVVVETETEAPAVLVLSDAFDDLWRAQLQGGPSLRVLRANFLVRAVEVPAGRHTVVFTYSARRVLAGAAVSVVGLAALAVYLLMGRRQERRGQASSSHVERGQRAARAKAD
jgi:hypothetical protein